MSLVSQKKDKMLSSIALFSLYTFTSRLCVRRLEGQTWDKAWNNSDVDPKDLQSRADVAGAGLTPRTTSATRHGAEYTCALLT